jgi:hypothetical protein
MHKTSKVLQISFVILILPVANVFSRPEDSYTQPQKFEKPRQEGPQIVFTPSPTDKVKVRFKQNSDMLRVKYEEINGAVFIKDVSSPLQMGRIDLRDVLHRERTAISEFVWVWHKGKFYFTASGFENIWMVNPTKEDMYVECVPIPLGTPVGFNPSLANDETGRGLVLYYATEKISLPQFLLISENDTERVIDIRDISAQENSNSSLFAWIERDGILFLTSENYKNVWMIGEYEKEAFPLLEKVGRWPVFRLSETNELELYYDALNRRTKLVFAIDNAEKKISSIKETY